MKEIKIEKFIISERSKPFIIAEVGINHNGELEKMLEMIEVAKKANVDCVKFQAFKADEFVADKTQMFTYTSQGKEITESMLEMFKRYEVKDEYWEIIKKKCDEVGIMFLATPQNVSDLDTLLKHNISAIKVGSDDFVNIPLLKKYKQTGLPMIVSCGMANFDEIKIVLDTIDYKNYPVILLLCTSQYPTPPEDVNLKKLKALKKEFPDLILGFSDHSEGSLAASVAVGLNAVVFEKHFTLSHDLAGPDHWFSANPKQLKQWADSIRIAHKMLGHSELRPTKKEIEMKKLARRKIVASCIIKKGEVFSGKNVELKRSYYGIEPSFYDTIIGRIAKKDILQSTPISLEDFE